MSATTEITQHSTGSQAKTGRQRSSLHALRAGFTGQLIVMAEEDLPIYEAHKKAFHDEYQPQGATEENLVEALGDVSWRLNRVVALETNLLSISYAPVSLVEGLLDQAKALSSLSLHSQRLSRQFESTVIELRELQEVRHSQEQRHLDELIRLMELHEEQGETSNLTPESLWEDGFVFSASQITRAGQLRSRARHLKEARETFA
jgi:hypothetical protein